MPSYRSTSKTSFLIFLIILVIAVSCECSTLATCSPYEMEQLPCMCCRKDCWYSVAEMATDYFGHMPGEQSESETKFTLQVMKHCISIECSEVCAKPK